LVLPPGIGSSPTELVLHLLALSAVWIVVNSLLKGDHPGNSPDRVFRLIAFGTLWGGVVWIAISLSVAVLHAVNIAVLTGVPVYETAGTPLWILLPIQMSVGIREELVFRGFFQTRLQQISGSAAAAIAGAAVLFAAVHVPMGFITTGASLLGGILFGFIRHHHRHVLPAGIAHGIYNCLVLLM